MTKDYLVQVRIRNGPFKRAMLRAGFSSAAELSRACGVQQTTISRYFGLKDSPYDRKNKDIRPSALKVAEALNCHPNDLFPKQHLHDPLEKNSTTFDADLIDIAALAESSSLIKQFEQHDLLQTALEHLPERDRQIVSDRFGLDGQNGATFAELGVKYGVNRTRIDQIQRRALRNLKIIIRERLHVKSYDALSIIAGCFYLAHDIMEASY